MKKKPTTEKETQMNAMGELATIADQHVAAVALGWQPVKEQPVVTPSRKRGDIKKSRGARPRQKDNIGKSGSVEIIKMDERVLIKLKQLGFQLSDKRVVKEAHDSVLILNSKQRPDWVVEVK